MTDTGGPAGADTGQAPDVGPQQDVAADAVAASGSPASQAPAPRAEEGARPAPAEQTMPTPDLLGGTGGVQPGGAG